MDKLKNKKKGFSTIELMLAMAIMVLVLTAVVVTSFGSQSFLIGSQTNAEAMKLAQGLLEETQALARKDFNLVNPKEEITEGIYTKSVSVKLLPDFLTKEVTAKVSWVNERELEQSVELTTLLTNFDSPIGGNTCDSTLTGNWSEPTIKDTYDFSAGTYLTDIDAYQGKLYVTAGKTASATDPTFFIFDINNENLNYKSGLDTTGPTVGSSGPNGVVATGDYAYVANGYGANFSSCVEGANCSQFQVVNISNATSPTITKNYKLPNITSSSGGGAGNSIFYKNGYIYLGLTSTGDTQSEFNIIDVHTPSAPANLGPGKDIGSNDANSIFVKGKYAYVATADSTERLKVIDIGNPNLPTQVSGFTGTGLTGKSIFGIGDSIYFGTTKGLSPSKYFLLDATNPRSIPSTPLSEKSFSASVDGIIVRDTLAFVLTKTALEIINTLDTNSLGSLSLSGSTGTAEPSFDCEGNYIYIAFNDSNGGKIYVVTSEPTP